MNLFGQRLFTYASHGLVLFLVTLIANTCVHAAERESTTLSRAASTRVPRMSAKLRRQNRTIINQALNNAADVLPKNRAIFH